MWTMANTNNLKKELKGLKLDDWDRKNIAAAIYLYELDNPPGKIRYEDITDETGKTVRWIEICNIGDYLANRRKDLINQRKLHSFSDHVIRDRPAEISVSLPPGLDALLRRGYPKLLTDEKQLQQFLKWFPVFNLTKG